MRTPILQDLNYTINDVAWIYKYILMTSNWQFTNWKNSYFWEIDEDRNEYGYLRAPKAWPQIGSMPPASPMRIEKPVTFAKVRAIVPPASWRPPRRPKNMVETMNLVNHITFMAAMGTPMGLCFPNSNHIWWNVGHCLRACWISLSIDRELEGLE